MLNLFAGQQADPLDIQRLVGLHAAGPLVLARASTVASFADVVRTSDDGEPSATAVVTTLLRLAAVGAYCLAEGAPNRNTSAVSLAHLQHVIRRAQERDERLVEFLRPIEARPADTPAEAAGGLSGRAPLPPAETDDMPPTEDPKTALDHVRDALKAMKARQDAAAAGAAPDTAHDADFAAALASLEQQGAADQARFSAIEDRLDVLEQGAADLDAALGDDAPKPPAEAAPAGDSSSSGADASAA